MDFNFATEFGQLTNPYFSHTLVPEMQSAHSGGGSLAVHQLEGTARVDVSCVITEAHTRGHFSSSKKCRSDWTNRICTVCKALVNQLLVRAWKKL